MKVFIKKNDAEPTQQYHTDQVVVETKYKTLNLIRSYNGSKYYYYTLDGTYVFDLGDFIVVSVKPMNRVFFTNQDSISYLDIEEPVNAMRPCELEKLDYFKG